MKQVKRPSLITKIKNIISLHHTPSLRALLPHLKRRTLLDLPSPLGLSLPTNPRIRALILDKDNTLCPPNTTFVHPLYREAIRTLKASQEFAHHPRSILIVSNTAGRTSNPNHEAEACELENQLGLPVFRQWQVRQGIQKPGVGKFVVQSLLDEGVVSMPREVAVVGDKIFTDVLMARIMGSWSVLLEDGWRDPDNPTKSYHDWGTWLERKLTKPLMDLYQPEGNEASLLLLPGERFKPRTFTQTLDEVSDLIKADSDRREKRAQLELIFAAVEASHGASRLQNLEIAKKFLEHDRILDEKFKQSARRRLEKLESASSSQNPKKPQ